MDNLGIQLGKGGKLAFGTLAKDKSNLEAVLKDPSKLAQVFAAEGESDKPVHLDAVDRGLGILCQLNHATIARITVGRLSRIGQGRQIGIRARRLDGELDEFKDTIPGLSFTVNQATKTGEPTLLTVVSDTEGMKKNIQAFMDAYNAISDKLVASS